jgi:DNA-binding MarR family transcriptional regulator
MGGPVKAFMNKIARLEDHLGYWLRFVSNQVSHSFRQRLEGEGVAVVEWVVLRILFEGEASPALLAEKIGITRGAMTKVIDRLFEKQLINRQEAIEDRRYQKITLTKKGLSLIPKLAKIADENELFYFSHLSAEEKERMADLLKKTVELHNLKQKPLD